MREATQINRTSAASGEVKADPCIEVHLRSHGDDAWRNDSIACTDWFGQLRAPVGAIDSVAQKAMGFARL